MAKNERFLKQRNASTILNVKDVKKQYGDQVILENIQLELKQGDCAGLVGYNGAGKTTLANLIFGKLLPDEGSITRKKDLTIGYLLQSVDYTVHDFKGVLEDQSIERIFETTKKLGLEKVQNWKEDRLHHLSGGEKLKLALAHVWATNPDLLILDEPTNHLDYHGIEWLADQLRTFAGTVLIISHDRYFLDRTVSHIFELENKKIKEFKGNYTAYRDEKKRLAEEQKHQYEVQQRYKAKIEGQMENLKNWSEKAHRESTKQGSPSERKQMGFKEYNRVKAKKMDIQVRSKLKRLTAELEKNKKEKPQEEAKVLFQFDSSGKRGKRVLEAKALEKTFGKLSLIKKSHFYIKHGERIGIIGKNGAGKSTLIRMIQGLEDVTGGELWKSETMKIAYLSQDVNDLREDATVLEALDLHEREQILRARTTFANMGLTEEKLKQPIGSLSLGERTRVKLVSMILKEYDVLILDEPTNHLDLPSREQLEETLDEFEGTIIMVSHDQYFMNKLCDKLLVFEDTVVRRVEMKLDDYFSKSRNEWNETDREKELLKIDHQLTAVLSKLSVISREDPSFAMLDAEYSRLLQDKRKLAR